MNSFKMAIRSINSNRMRALLTMLGIIIGVMALVVLVSIVNGATDLVAESVDSMGKDLVTIYINDDKGAPITLGTVRDWVDEDPLIGNISPYYSTTGVGKYGAQNENFQIYGVTPAYFEVQGLNVDLGRLLKQTDVDNNTRVCVINNAAATGLIGFADCIGEQLSINGMKFTVVGVLSEQQTVMASLMAMIGESYSVYIPYTSLMRISEEVTANVKRLEISAPENVNIAETKNAITARLLERFAHDENAFRAYSSDTMEGRMNAIKGALSMMLGGIAAISLIVGGIGIMNIMMVTVTERTREIGIRKAIGASRGTILRQFLMEAVVLCMLGCAAGILISWSILRLVTVIGSGLSLNFELNKTVCLIAVAFCFLIGVVFGLYPANKAAKMKPIDALHYGG